MKEKDKIIKDHIKMYVLPHRKQKIQETAKSLGFSDSQFLLQCYNFWSQHNNKS